MPAASCENCGSQLPTGQPLLPGVRRPRRRGAGRDRGRGAAAGRDRPGAGRVRGRPAALLRRLPAGQGARAGLARAPRDDRLRRRVGHRPLDRARRALPAAPGAGATCWRSGPSPPVSSERRCTLATRKGSKRPASGWRSSTGSSARRRKRWSEQPQTRWSASSGRSSRCSRPRSSRRLPSPEPFPEPSPPPQPVPVPEPTPEPSEPPGPAHVPEPTPAPEPAAAAGVGPSRAGTPAAPTKSRLMRFRRLFPLLVALAGRLGDARERRRREPQAGDRRAHSSGCRRRSPGRSSESGRSPARSRRSTARSARSTRRSASSRRGSRRSSATSSCTRRSSTG